MMLNGCRRRFGSPVRLFSPYRKGDLAGSGWLIWLDRMIRDAVPTRSGAACFGVAAGGFAFTQSPSGGREGPNHSLVAKKPTQ